MGKAAERNTTPAAAEPGPCQTVAHFTCPKCGRRWTVPCEQTISIDFYGECIPCRFVPVGGKINKHGSGAGTAKELEAIRTAAPKPEDGQA